MERDYLRGILASLVQSQLGVYGIPGWYITSTLCLIFIESVIGLNC